MSLFRVRKSLERPAANTLLPERILRSLVHVEESFDCLLPGSFSAFDERNCITMFEESAREGVGLNSEWGSGFRV